MRALKTAMWKLAFAMTMLPESPSGKFGFSPPDELYFATRLRDGLGERGRTPLRSRTERQQRAWQAAD
jgi:hypothetical protein